MKVILLPHTSLSYILQISAARIVDIDFSKPKRLSANEVCTAHDVEAVTGVKQPSENDTSSLFEKLATNSKSVALLSTVPEFCDMFISAPNTEPNIPMCLGDLYSEDNRRLTQEELRLLFKCAADELVEKVRHCILNLPLENNQRA